MISLKDNDHANHTGIARDSVGSQAENSKLEDHWGGACLVSALDPSCWVPDNTTNLKKNKYCNLSSLVIEVPLIYEKKKKVKLIPLRIWNIVGKGGDGSWRGREVEAGGFVRDPERKAVCSW